MKNTTCYSDFWFEDYDIDWDFEDDSVVDTSHAQSDSTEKLIRLSSARRAISNYVSILTNKSIPVMFNDNNNSMTDGKVVYIGADASSKKNFDIAVGLALHEGSHICYSNFDLFKNIWGNVPREISDLGKKLKISKSEIAELVKTLTNIVEDRYIDHTVYYSAPGYRGYYQALYDKYFNAKVVDDGLKSEMYRVPSIESYLFRIINITNKFTDLTALPGLYNIAKILGLSSIQRLTTPKDRFEVACNIAEVILSNIDQHMTNSESLQLSDGEGNEGDENEEKPDTFSIFDDIKNNSVPKDKPSDNLDDILGGEDTQVESSKSDAVMNDIGDDEKMSDNKKNKLAKAFNKQKTFVSGDIKRKKVTKKENDVLDIIEKSKVDLVDVGQQYMQDQYGLENSTVECILVKNMTRELIFSHEFPMTPHINRYFINSGKKPSDNPYVEKMQQVIDSGISMGIKLGKRLQFRNEVNVEKYSRRETGKLDKRLISELGYNMENIFYTTHQSKYKKMHFHISVDASSSMIGPKWEKSIKLTTAIAKAASILENIRVSISFRSTSQNKPYVIMAYDSDKDKFNKIKNLFCYLSAHGTTPEGLAFEAILKTLPKADLNSENYFINISDGEPAFSFQETKNNNKIMYQGQGAAKHTKIQCKKIKKEGYNIISYFVSETESSTPWLYRGFGGSNPGDLFKIMYGTDAIFTNVENLSQVVTTLNKKMLESIDI